MNVSFSLLSDVSWVGWAVRLLFGTTVAWVVALSLVLALRRSSAAVRHRIWGLSTICVLVLPALMSILPEFRTGWLPLLPGDAATTREASSVDWAVIDEPMRRQTDRAGRSVSTDVTEVQPMSRTAAMRRREAVVDPSISSGITMPNWGLFLLWLAPAITGLVLIGRSLCLARRLVHQASQIADPACLRWLNTLLERCDKRLAVTLRESEETHSPLCVGWRRPCILLPSSWSAWPEGHLRAVLAHELAHAVRRDVGWQLLARAACAVYWFHPLAWLAPWRMRVEREQACDDWALSAGQPPTGYARVLLDLVTQCRTSHVSSMAAVTMVGSGGFERRVRAILAKNRRRSPVGRFASRLLAAATLGVALATGAINPLSASRAVDQPEAARTETASDKFADRDQAARAVPREQAVDSPQNAQVHSPAAAKLQPAEPTLRVQGLVVDDRGQPAAGVRVEAYVHRSRPSTVSDRDGRFELEFPEQRNSGLHLRAIEAETLRQASLQIDDATRLPQGIQLVLRAPREVRVQVVNGEQLPVAGAFVAVLAHYNELTEAVSDDSGLAVLQVPADASLQYVVAGKADIGVDYFIYRRQNEPVSDPYRLPPDHQGPLTLVLNGTRSVTVRVLDELGQPMAGVMVYPWYFEKPQKGGTLNSGLEWFHVTTDIQGRAVFQNVPADSTERITFWPFSDGYFAPERTTYDPRGGATELTATLLSKVPLCGQVVFSDGRPAEGAEVTVSGEGHYIDSFNETAQAGENGNFQILVNPNHFCVIAASLEGWATPLVARVVRQGQPVDGLRLVLQKATRVHGRLTTGKDHQPLPNEHLVLVRHRDVNEYLNLADAEKFPNPTNDRKSISPRISQNTRTDVQGEFEFFTGPGQCYIYGLRGTERPRFELAGQAELEVNLLSDAPDTIDFKGRVVLKSDPNRGMAEVRIVGLPLDVDAGRFEVVTDAQGLFNSPRTVGEMHLCAENADHTLGAIVRVEGNEASAEIPLAPTATARGRLIDAITFQPLPMREIQCGLQIENATHYFGASAITDENGEFTLAGLVPGWKYRLTAGTNRDPNVQERNSQTLVVIEPGDVTSIELRDLKLRLDGS